MLLTSVVGQPPAAAGGAQLSLRGGKLGDLIVSELHGRYYEQAYQGNLYWGGNTATKATTVGLATTYTGLVLHNPPGSGVNLELLSFGISVTVAEVAIATQGLIGGFAAAGIATSTTTVAQGSTFIGPTFKRGSGQVFDTATLVGTPVWLLQTRAGFTAGALSGAAQSLLDVAGMFVIAPGGYVALGTLTATTMLGHFIWGEVTAP